MPISNSVSGKPPSDYKEVLYWKISEKAGRIAMMNLLPIPLAVVFGISFFIFVRLFGNSPKFIWSDNEILIFLIGTIVVLVLHEFVHGLTMQAFGAKAKYGFWGKGLMFYAKAPGYAFKRNQYLIIILGPLVCLSILACCGIAIQSGTSIVWLFAIWAIVNASASGGDVWITAIVLRYPASAFVVDERDGMRIYLPQSDDEN
ncbi:MAG: DUF3267 domain-containing protein [Anaerolineaceae bacterium]